MIRADQIPLEVRNAISAARKKGASSAEIAAALNAWPGSELEHDIRKEPRTIYLPILEVSDE